MSNSVKKRQRQASGHPRVKLGSQEGSESGNEDSFVWQVAELAWAAGLAPNAIARRLGLPSNRIMEVKRALQKAIRKGFLQLAPPLLVTCKTQLEENKRWKARTYTVVDDAAFTEANPVCMRAAEKIDTIVRRLLLHTRSSKRDVIIANAGGQTVGQTVKYLGQIATEPDAEDRNRLVSISLNSAGRRRQFDKSANFLAVRIAEIFGGRHIAVLPHTDFDAEDDYMEKVRAIDLLICGAGSRDGMLVTHTREKQIGLPTRVVGDLAFIPLDAQGRFVQDPNLDTAVASLNAQPEYSEVLRIARDESKEVLVILDGKNPGSKMNISDAILTAGLVTDCVLSASIARHLLNKYGLGGEWKPRQ